MEERDVSDEAVVPETDGERPASRGILLRVILPWLCLLALVGGYFAFLADRVAPAIVTPDANGYWAQGSLLFTSGRTWFEPESEVQYVGLHWLVTDSGKYFSRYPPGLPVLVGAVYHTFGHEATVWIDPVLAALALVGLYVLARQLLAPGWCLAAVAALALTPTFTRHALVCDSHMAVLCCLVWGVFLLLRWSESGKLWRAFLAGVVLGCIPAVRYPETLFGLGLGVFLLSHVRSHRRMWLHYIAAAAGAAVPLAPLLVRNHLDFGAFYRTGYELTNEQTGFSLDYFQSHAIQYIRFLHGEGVGLLFPLGVLGMAALCLTRGTRRVGLLLLLLVVPSTLLYMAYYWAPEGMPVGTMRFLLPTFACYVVAGVWALSRGLAQTSRLFTSGLVILLLAFQGLWGVSSILEETRQLHYQRDVLSRVTAALEEHVAPGSVVISDSQLLQHLDFVRRWRLMDRRLFMPSWILERVIGMRAEDDPTPLQRAKLESQVERYKGMSLDEKERAIAREVAAWADGQKVYFVSTQTEIDLLAGRLLHKGYLNTVATVPLPEAPPEPERRGMLGSPVRPGPGAALPGRPGGQTPLGAFARRFGRGGLLGRQRRPSLGRWSAVEGEKEVLIAEWSHPAVKSPR